MKVGIYARVSTKDKGQDTENQLVQLREFAAKQGWQIVREYIDHETGSKSDRAEFQAMFADASRRTGYPAKAHWKRSSTCNG
jgi:DNA invertase Pin-like site-specific DNA recombinase